jgi:C-terminal processing protease CtpA/Prc
VPIFFPGSSMHVVDAVRSLREAGARALVLDVRGNPGGAVADALVMADLFVGSGRRLVEFRGRSRAPQAAALRERAYEGTESEADFAGPLVVLQDGSSASASELLAMALRDAGRARIVGERSFGKGVAQLVVPVGVPKSKGGPRLSPPVVDWLSVTALRFVSGSGAIDPHGCGLEPDVLAEDPGLPEAELRARLEARPALDAYVDERLPLDGDLSRALSRDDGGDPARWPAFSDLLRATGSTDPEMLRRRLRERLRQRRILAGLDAGPDPASDPALRAAVREALARLEASAAPR